MAEISVIVPVYNVKRYLKECLDSIINQTFKDIEIICVNDGSTDGSEKILKEYENKESRIILINKKNGGLSSARNAGMKIAKGKFLCFVDSDDKIELTMLEKLYKNITSLNSDISICAVHQLDETNKTIDDSNPYFNLGYFNSQFDNKVFSCEDVKPFFMNVCVMAWNKLYRRSFIKECNAEFPENLIFEDGPFFFSIFFKTKRVSIVRDFLYFYRINRTGSILKKCGVNFIDIIDVVNLMFEYLKQSPVFEDVKYDFYRAKADDIMYRYRLINFIFRNKFLKKLKKDSCLFDESVFDFAYINKTMPDIYKNLFIMREKADILNFYYGKFTKRLMYKIMQILYTEENIYYFKFWSLKFRIKKRVYLFDMWYENDKIYIILFNRIKFNFKFEYSKLEQK